MREYIDLVIVWVTYLTIVNEIEVFLLDVGVEVMVYFYRNELDVIHNEVRLLTMTNLYWNWWSNKPFVINPILTFCVEWNLCKDGYLW